MSPGACSGSPARSMPAEATPCAPAISPTIAKHHHEASQRDQPPREAQLSAARAFFEAEGVGLAAVLLLLGHVRSAAAWFRARCASSQRSEQRARRRRKRAAAPRMVLQRIPGSRGAARSSAAQGAREESDQVEQEQHQHHDPASRSCIRNTPCPYILINGARSPPRHSGEQLSHRAAQIASWHGSSGAPIAKYRGPGAAEGIAGGGICARVVGSNRQPRSAWMSIARPAVSGAAKASWSASAERLTQENSPSTTTSRPASRRASRVRDAGSQ